MFKQQTTEKQRETFVELTRTENIRDILNNLTDVKSIVNKEWQNNSENLSKVFNNPKMLENFLSLDFLQGLFFVNSQGDLLRDELSLLEEMYTAEELSLFLSESKIGSPPFTYKYNTTHNTIHHLYHLSRYNKQTGKDIRSAESVVEWGGGYGNMCKVANNFFYNLKTYTILDLPECLLLQYLYLSSLFGTESVNLSFDGVTVDNKINLLSFDKYKHNNNKANDLFISTWALSESPIELQDKVENINWFNSEKILVSFHQCGDHIPFMKESTNLGYKLKKSNCTLKNVQVIPGKNVYAFR